MRVLIGFDGSPGADDAVELARWLTAGDEGEALLVNVLPHPGALPVAYYLLDDEETPWEREFFTTAAAKLAPLAVRWASYVGGSPAQILTATAENDGFELIVIGSPHRGTVGRALLGSVAQGVLHGAPVPVAVAPRGYAGERHDPLGKIAVAYDGSAESEAALASAVALASRHGAALELLTVATIAPVTPSFPGLKFPPAPTPGEVIEQGLAAVGEGVEASGRELHAGSIPSGLLAACEDADLLVAGSRGYGTLGRVLVGSVSSELVDLAPCPVVVVPRPDDGD